jgi:hypothetical protein
LKDYELKNNGVVKAVHPDAVENPERIVSAFITLEINDWELTGFVPNWIEYFHSQRRKNYPFGDSLLIKSLVGKTIIIITSLLGDKNEDRRIQKGNYSIQSAQKRGDYSIMGKIVSKAKYPPLPKEFEYLLLDMGIYILHSPVKKGKYNLGEIISSKGRLDFEIIQIPSINDNPKKVFTSRFEKILKR